MKPRWRRGMQGGGFVIGLGLLAWCVHIALSEDNREQLQHLVDASAWEVASLLGTSTLVVIINGLIFWAVLWPVRKLGLWHMLSVNATATLLSYAPFKTSLAFRLFVHNRVDRMPLLMIGAWFLAIGVLSMCVIMPALLASLLLPAKGLWWWLAWIGGSFACGIGATLAASRFAGDVGWDRLKRRLELLHLGRALNWIGEENSKRLHAGVDMLSHRGASAAGAGLRVADIVTQAVRMWIAAQVLHVELGWGATLVVSSTYMLIGFISPIGILGPRETGAAAVASLAGLSAHAGAEAIVTVGLLVSASEAVVNLALGGAGAAYLRVDRWLWKKEGLKEAAATSERVEEEMDAHEQEGSREV